MQRRKQEHLLPEGALVTHEAASLHPVLTELLASELKIYCPVPLVIHPAGAEKLDACGVRWSVEQELCAPGSRATRMNVGLCVAAGSPFVTEEAAMAATCYFYFGLLKDDYLESRSHDPGYLAIQAAEANRVLLEPRSAPVPDCKWLTALRSLADMFESLMTPEQMTVWRSEHMAWVIGELWKFSLQRREAPPPPGEYLRMRWYKGGIGTIAALAALDTGYALSAEEFRDPLVSAFTRAVGYSCLLINDLISLEKESPLGQSGLNIVSVVSRHADGPIAALAEVWKLWERMICLMLRLQGQLLNDPRPAVARYATEFPHWIPATLHWTTTSARYLQLPGTPGGPGARIAPQTVTMTDTPTLWDPDDLTPPPYPEIAWWWNQLAD